MYTNYCISLTKKGVPCKNVAKEGLYCNIHSKEKSNFPITINLDHINLDGIKVNYETLDRITGPVIEQKVIKITGECPICCNVIYDDTDAKLECNHQYCFNCVVQLRNDACPTCRTQLKSVKINENMIKNINQRSKLDKQTEIDQSIAEYLQNEGNERNTFADTVEMVDRYNVNDLDINNLMDVILNTMHEGGELDMNTLLDFYTANFGLFQTINSLQ